MEGVGGGAIADGLEEAHGLGSFGGECALAVPADGEAVVDAAPEAVADAVFGVTCVAGLVGDFDLFDVEALELE